MNKTQVELFNRLVNRASIGSIKNGWTLTMPKGGNPFLRLQKANEGQQAHMLAQKYPDVFAAKQISFKLVDLELLDETKARSLVK